MEFNHYRIRRLQKSQLRQNFKPKVVHKKDLAIDEKRSRYVLICWDCNKRVYYSFECPEIQVPSINAGEVENQES